MTIRIGGALAPQHVSNARCFAFQGNRLLCLPAESGFNALPTVATVQSHFASLFEPRFLGWLGESPCVLLEVEPEQAADAAGFELTDLRVLAFAATEAFFAMVARARQVLEWERTHRYCGACGAPTESHASELARVCSRCSQSFYPRLSPCIIVLVTRGEEVLLARAPRFPPQMFSTLAGFVEAGETLEMALHREVMEEVGIEVDNIRYHSSQSWPFPHSLMVGFHADYRAGEICVDGEEIVEAGWWSINQLPQVPPRGSIAHQLIMSYQQALAAKSV